MRATSLALGVLLVAVVLLGAVPLAVAPGICDGAYDYNCRMCDTWDANGNCTGYHECDVYVHPEGGPEECHGVYQMNGGP